MRPWFRLGRRASSPTFESCSLHTGSALEHALLTVAFNSTGLESSTSVCGWPTVDSVAAVQALGTAFLPVASECSRAAHLFRLGNSSVLVGAELPWRDARQRYRLHLELPVGGICSIAALQSHLLAYLILGSVLEDGWPVCAWTLPWIAYLGPRLDTSRNGAHGSWTARNVPVTGPPECI